MITRTCNRFVDRDWLTGRVETEWKVSLCLKVSGSSWKSPLSLDSPAAPDEWIDAVTALVEDGVEQVFQERGIKAKTWEAS